MLKIKVRNDGSVKAKFKTDNIKLITAGMAQAIHEVYNRLDAPRQVVFKDFLVNHIEIICRDDEGTCKGMKEKDESEDDIPEEIRDALDSLADSIIEGAIGEHKHKQN